MPALVSIAKEQLTVTNAAVVPFTAATYTTGAMLAVVSVGDAEVRTDCGIGSDPTTSTGLPWKKGTKFKVIGSTDIVNFGAIATTSTSATLDVEYFGIA